MSERSSIDVEWELDAEASSDEVAAVAQIALEEGLPGQVTAGYGRRSAEVMDEMTRILVPIVISFLKAFFGEAGRSAYKDLRRLVSRVFAARRKGQGTVEISDRGSKTMIVFTPDLPEEAFKQLAKLGLENIDGGYWVWDSNQGCWKSRI